MNEILLVTFIVITIFIIGVLVWLILEHRKLKQDYLILNGFVQRNNQDIAGLCSAAVFVDNKISENINQIKSVVEKMDDYEQDLEKKQLQQQNAISQPYYNAIQRVRSGANAGDLIQQVGVSREEAELLIRLHGHK